MDNPISKTEIGIQLRRLREQTGLTQKQVSTILGRNQQSINHWESGYSQPNIETLLQLLDIYGVDSVFTPNQRFRRNMSSEEMQLVAAYHRAAPVIQRAAKRLLSVDEDLSEQRSAVRSLPVYPLPDDSRKVSGFLDSEEFDLVEAGGNVPISASFGVVLPDDSLSPLAEKGQTLWVRRQKSLEHGDVGLFSFNGTILVKRLWKQLDRTSLISPNEKYASITVSVGDSVRILGKVIA